MRILSKDQCGCPLSVMLRAIRFSSYLLALSKTLDGFHLRVDTVQVPKVMLHVLDPLEVRDYHAAGVGQEIRF